MLVAEQTAYLYWLKQRDATLKEAKSLIKEKLQPGDVDFREEYGENGQETYEVFRVEGWPKNGDPYMQHETIWEYVSLEDLVEQIKDAQARAKKTLNIHITLDGAEVLADRINAVAEGLEPLEIVDDREKEFLKRNEEFLKRNKEYLERNSE